MGDALRGRLTGLDGRDDLVLQDAGRAISCRLSVRLPCKLLLAPHKSRRVRINFPGYPTQ